MALFRVRVELHFTTSGLASWAREQNSVRATRAKPINAGQRNEERVRHSVVGNRYVGDLPFPDRATADEVWAFLAKVVADSTNLQPPTRDVWSSADLHECNNTDPPQPCTTFLQQWSNEPTRPPRWDAALLPYTLGAEVTHNMQWWRSTVPANVAEPGEPGWEVF